MSPLDQPTPFARFGTAGDRPMPLRAAIAAACRRAEPDAVLPLLEEARLPAETRAAIAATARRLVTRLREKPPGAGAEGLVKEYSLSSHEGVALMCLAEALLRVPDNATRDALIRDKIARGDWRAHMGDSRSIFVNAATWGLVVTGKLVTPVMERGLGAALADVIKRFGEPVIRSGVALAMQMLGEQFVTGETIAQALQRARKQEKLGFSYSYDMLGEAAMTMADAKRYYAEYESAIHAIGKAAQGRGVYAGPGISIKLSALHPRYSRAQRDRVMGELQPSVRQLALLAKSYDIGLNIDAEEADRLDLSLDILESLALDPALDGWQGLGFVIQAYGKRCRLVVDWLIDLATRSGHRIMVRLVKGAYWDSEIKRAQVDGLADFPVFTRKVHTDVSYVACARKLLAARSMVFPQFATHNAQTLATVYHLAGPEFTIGDYEFQCLHGMGEALYEEVVGAGQLDRPCRIYAPVGKHETLLAYLVRRLLENGANSSFVHRIQDETIALDDLVAEPVQQTERNWPVGSAHPLIAHPHGLFPDRRNSRGADLSDEQTLRHLSRDLWLSARLDWQAVPAIAGVTAWGAPQAVRNPADRRDVVGHVVWARREDARQAARHAQAAFARWAVTPVDQRAACLERAADSLETDPAHSLALLVREAGKSIPSAVGEVREAVDFLRYYAQAARHMRRKGVSPLGPVVCISPWNFPLAIFTGQIAAALASGNVVLAKPAEETPLIAAHMVGLLHRAGVPHDVLQLVPGDGAIGAALVAAPEACGVIFTGSTEVAKLIQRQLADRLLDDGSPIPLVAETGGQNAMIVDSSALPEQVVRDVMASAFDSAGQRCSALRVLCLQEDIADDVLTMLRGALAQVCVGSPDQLCTDIGPIITEQAHTQICAHIAAMRVAGHAVEQIELGDATLHGTFVAPTIITIDRIGQLGREVFGPVLHVLCYRSDEMSDVIQQIKDTGYGLTFGLHSRIDETIANVIAHAPAGNIYVNRNMIGAVVGVQPFGGHGLSGTGPKAGGPLYLGRLVRRTVADPALPLGEFTQVPSPVGEQNLYGFAPRGQVLLLPATEAGLREQLLAVLATGNSPILPVDPAIRQMARNLLPDDLARLRWVVDWTGEAPIAHVLIEDAGQDVRQQLRQIAHLEGGIPIVQLGGRGKDYHLDWMIEEVSISIDTTAAGGNASLMALV